MKIILIICIVSLCAAIKTNAQLRDTTLTNHNVDAKILFQKAKKQKTAAWILLGTGAGLAIAGCAIIIKEAGEEANATLTTVFSLGLITPEEPKHYAAGPILAIAGTAAMLGSISIFIASGKNKGKANLIIKNEKVYFSPQLNLKENFIAIGLKIKL